MANNEIKTNAEIYREQRKARLAKAAKKKSSGKADKAIRIVMKLICILLIVGIVLFGAAKMLTDVFCVPQKLLTAATYGDEKLTIAEYNYYYMALYNQAASQASQYDSEYGEGAGAMYYFDTSVSPSAQEYKLDDAPEGVETWADYFREMACERGMLIKTLYAEATSDEAVKAGFKLTEEEQTELDTAINEAMETLETQAKQADFALDNYIAKVCGEGLTAESYEELIRKDSVAQYYLSWYQTKLSDDIAEDEVNDYYKDNRSDIDVASFRIFGVSYAEPTEETNDPVYTQKQAKARADKFASEVTSEESFIAAANKYAPPSQQEDYIANDAMTLCDSLDKSSISAISEEMANWTFDASRKPGEISVFVSEEYEEYYIVYIIESAHKVTTTSDADVRHILIQAETTKEDSQGQQVALEQDEIDKNLVEAKKEADKILAEWKKGDATEESFGELATKYTDDGGSATTGGLYEGINKSSNYVPEFLNWALADHKPGDTEIIKTTYGYHIMYFVGASKTQQWEADIRSSISTERFNEYFDGIFNDITDKIEESSSSINFFVKRLEKVIDRNISSAASSTVSY